MEEASKATLIVLQWLLPGFLSAWIFYGLTSYPKPSQFERVVEALIFTYIVHAITMVDNDCWDSLGKYFGAKGTNDLLLVNNVVNAVIIGVLFAIIANNDIVHWCLRKLRVTSETSYPSEWFGAFRKIKTLVVLQLEGERQIYGWPTEWPSQPGNGHFLLEQASWVDGENEIPITGAKAILIDAKLVEWVEFMEPTWEKKDEKSS